MEQKKVGYSVDHSQKKSIAYIKLCHFSAYNIHVASQYKFGIKPKFPTRICDAPNHLNYLTPHLSPYHSPLCSLYSTHTGLLSVP